MILILSQSVEKSTDDVLQYLTYYGCKYKRINDIDNITSIDISFEDSVSIEFVHNDSKIDLNKVKSYWYRRGYFYIGVPDIPNDLIEQDYYKYYLFYLKNEYQTIIQFLNFRLKSIPHISSFYNNYISKLVQLDVAKKVGLKVPNTLITGNKDLLKKFHNIYSNKILVKAFDSSHFRDGKKNQYIGNHVEMINNLKDNDFLLSKFQAYLDKKFEVRSYFLNGKLYSMAIFSQQNEMTKLDFRNYDFNNPNRNVNFKLPTEIESKIVELMKALNMNSGSIDFIYTFSRDFIFLEVNPVGQFDWLSKNCNFYIPKIIANFLRDEN